MKPFFSRNHNHWQVIRTFLALSFLVTLLSVLLAGCSSNKAVPVEQANPAAYPEARAIIPITYYDEGYIPVFQVQDDQGGWKWNLGFDSGYGYNALYSSAITKEWETGIQQWAEGYVKNQHPNLSQRQVEKAAHNLVESGGASITISDFEFAGISIDSRTVSYEPVTSFKDQTIDGMVGLEFFGECRTVTIDYANHLIVLDAPPIQGESLPLSRSEFHTLYTIPVTIDGVPQTAIVDTGAEWFMKAGKKALSMSEEEKWDFVLNGRNVVKWTMGWKTVELGYGSTTEKVRSIAATNMFTRASAMATRMATVYNLFGWSVMKERAVQFDFENSRLILGQRRGGNGQ